MRFANDVDISRYHRIFDDGATPNLAKAAATIDQLRHWANDNSDGWAYWPKPCRSAAKLIELCEDAVTSWYNGGFLADVSTADLKRALGPVKAFLTRQGVDHAAIIA